MNQSDSAQNKLLSSMNQKWKMRLLFLFKLPSAWFWGIKIKSVNSNTAIISLAYSWFSKNPFHSIYFAAQSGAAELSTGLLAIVAIEDKPPISMLISRVEATFVKKATSQTCFSCDEGEKIRAIVEQAINTGEGQEITVSSIGINNSGEVVSRFKFTWSFKLKKS